MQSGIIEQRLIEVIDFDILNFFAHTKGESLMIKQTQIGYTIALHWFFKLAVIHVIKSRIIAIIQAFLRRKENLCMLYFS